MTRGRIFTALGVLALLGLGLTVLMAANGAGNQETGAAKPRGNRLVFIGQVDTDAQMTSLYPKNFPQPSQVVEVLVKEGAKVKKDQPLLKFDTELLELKVQEAERAIGVAQFEQTKAEALVRKHAWEVNSLEKKWRAKQAELEQSASELKELQRVSLIDRKLVPQLTLEAAEKKYLAAQLTLEATKIELDGLRAEVPSYLVEQAKANIKMLETKKAEAEHARDSMSCKAPANGRIIRSFISAGTLFGPTSRDPAFWFLEDAPLIVRGEVTQEFASRISVGKSATIVDEADSKQEWTGKVSKVGDQFLQKRLGGASVLDFMPVSDDRVLECHVSINLKPGETPPKFGQKMRISVE
jgi:multidrug efflux pump subunit AcrA (membrane-fusion protein)